MAKLACGPVYLAIEVSGYVVDDDRGCLCCVPLPDSPSPHRLGVRRVASDAKWVSPEDRGYSNVSS